jgi:acyl-CoA thioester hydrolase
MSDRPEAVVESDQGRYPQWVRETIRQNDTDLNGHVNNAVIATYFEIGRISLFDGMMGHLADAGLDVVVRKLTMEYLAELHYPGHVNIGSRGLYLRRTSFGVDQTLLGEKRCVATAQAVCVFIGRASRRPQQIDATLRELLTRAWAIN